MNTLLIDIPLLTSWFLSTKSSKENEEFEIRLKDISKTSFEIISYTLSLSSSNIMTISDETYSFQEYRKIISVNNNIIYQRKEKQPNYDITIVTKYNPFSTQEIRFSKSFEHNLTKEEFENNVKKIPPYIRKRLRTVYKYDTYEIDCTIVTDNIGKVSYEIEIESNIYINDILMVISLIKNSFNKCFPDLHTLYSVDKYNGLLTTVNSRILPNSKQPVNIQKSHFDKNNSSFIGNSIVNYSLTNKLDGVNYKLHTFKDKSYIILHNNTDLWLEKINTKLLFNSILNVEVTKDNKIHIFDILSLDEHTDLLNYSLQERLNIITKVNTYIKDPNIVIKQFFTSNTVELSIQQCIQHMTKSYLLNIPETNTESGVEFYNDGIIFQHNGGLVLDKNIIPSLKWKFPSKITIDFLAKYYTKDNNSITYQLYTKVGNDKYSIYKTPLGVLASIKFELPSMCDGINCNNLDDKVLEVGWDRVNNSFKLFKIRFDKTKDRTNFITVANETYPQMVNIYTLSSLIKDITSQNNDVYTVPYEPGIFPLKRNHKLIEETSKDMSNMFKKLKDFDVNTRLYYNFSYKSGNTIIENSIPGIYISDKKLKNIIFKYKTDKGDYLAFKSEESDYSNIDILTDYFSESVRIKGIVKSEGISPEEYHIKNYDKLIKKCKSNGLDLTNYNIRELIFKEIKETTLFKLTVCKSILQLLSPSNNTKKLKWLDISAGWGDRLLTAIACDVDKYVGFDPNTSLEKPHSEIIKEFGNNDINKYKVIYKPFESGILDLPQDEMFNLVFTSPPFFDFEIYTNDKSQSIEKYNTFEKWLNLFLFKSIQESYNRLEYGGYLALYIVDIGKFHIVDEIFQYINKECKDLKYKGMIANIPLNNKIPKPVWIWERKDTCDGVLDNMRKIHNDYKRDLILKYTKNKSVLDLGSGKGGDIHKYSLAGIQSITMVEPNEVNIKECISRLKSSKLQKISEVIHSTAENFKSNKKYDVICLFYILTFFYESRHKLQQLVDIIANHLNSGGYCIGGTANGIPMLNKLEDGDIVNECYSIKIDNLISNDNFGKSIFFDLKSSETATSQKEYLVFFDEFVKMLKEHSIMLESFIDYKRRPELNDTENDITELYSDFVFKKVDYKYYIGKSVSPDCITTSIMASLFIKEDITPNLISTLSLEDYAKLDNGKLAIDIFKNFIEKHKTELTKYNSHIISKINNTVDIFNVFELITYNKLDSDEIEIVEGIIVITYEDYRKSLIDCKLWNNNYLIKYLSEKIKCNICIYKNKLISTNGGYPIINEYPCIAIYTNDNKYYPIYRFPDIYIFNSTELGNNLVIS